MFRKYQSNTFCLQNLLLLEEFKPPSSVTWNKQNVVEIKDAKFLWEDQKNTHVENKTKTHQKDEKDKSKIRFFPCFVCCVLIPFWYGIHVILCFAITVYNRCQI